MKGDDMHRVYIGIDWSENKHDAAFVNSAGAHIASLTFKHTVEGFRQFDATRSKLGLPLDACLVGIETAHNLLIDFLWSRAYSEVYVIPPSVVKSSRGRDGPSGAHTDYTDAVLIANMLRTDLPRFHPWHPGSVLTRQIRAQVSLINYLTRKSVSAVNRLRAVLIRYYPAALEPFGHLRSQISLKFVQDFPSPQTAQSLTLDELKAFAAAHSYTQPRRLPGYLAALHAPHPQAAPETVLIYQDEAVFLAEHLLSLRVAKVNALHKLTKLFQQHPDAPIFDSLPGVAQFLAPALLAFFGEDRQRFPTKRSIQCLAGTCPVTVQSGKHRVVKFRRACDHDFRTVTQQWAKSSLAESTWANAYWQRVRPHCDSDSHAYRCLANRWLAILWKMWQTREPYDEARHLQQLAKYATPRQDFV